MTRSARAGRDHRSAARAESLPFWALCALLACVFLLGGSSREDALSLVVLRPLAVAFLGFGLWGLTREQALGFRAPLTMLAAAIVFVGVQLIPLPPAIWTALPGRALAVAVGEAAGVGQPWRPFTLVPWRGWNTMFSLAVPAAAMVLTIRCTPAQRNRVLWVIIGLGLASALFAYFQAIGGYRPGLNLYRISSEGWPNGLFANRNHHAAMIACLFPALAALSTWRVGDRAQLLRFACAGVGIALFLLLVITGSRAGFATGLLGLGAGALIIARDGKLAFTRSRRWMVGLAALAAAAVAAAVVAMPHATVFERVFRSDVGQDARPDIWQVTWEAAKSYFPAGSGAGSFVEVYKVHEPTRVLSEFYVNHAHNDWLEWLLEGGLGAALFLAVATAGWAIALVRIVKTGRRGMTQSERIGLAGAAIILILGLSSAVDYPLRVPSLATMAAVAAIWMAGAGWERRTVHWKGDPELQDKTSTARTHSQPRRTDFSA